MSLRVKLVSAFAMMFLMIGILIVGIFAAQQQTLTMTGNVQFNINDRSLYVKQVRIKQDNSSAEPQVVSDFMPGYINGEFNMNIGEYDNSLGSFALYFDIINATDDEWEITKVTLSEQLQSEQVSVTYSGIIETNDIAEKDDNGYKIFDPETTDIDGSLILVVTAPNSSSIDLSGITITLNVYIPPVLEGFTFDNNGTLVSYTGSDTEVVIPSSYSIIEGEPVDKTLEFDSFEEFLNDMSSNMATYTSMTNFTVEVDEETYGPYTDFNTFYEAMNGGLTNIMLNATSIIFKYQEKGDTYIEGDDYLVTSIGSSVFAYNTSITRVELPLSLKSIESSAFEGCSGLASINLSDCINLETIGEQAFQDCGEIANIDLSKCTKLTSIGDEAFYGCIELTNITLPSSLTSIGPFAFYYCTKLNTIRIEATTPPTFDGSTIPSTIATIEVPSASVDAYKSGWSSYADKIVGY